MSSYFCVSPSFSNDDHVDDNDNCEFTREFPALVNNHLQIVNTTTTNGKNNKHCHHVESIKKYIKQLVGVNFVGQTTDDEDTDYYKTTYGSNLGTALENFSSYLEEGSAGNDEYSMEKIKLHIREISQYRQQVNESVSQTNERLLKDCNRFLTLLKKRGPVQKLTEPHYWGTRQQLLAGKVIADWVDHQNVPLDPIFGALLTPTAGRVGPGNSCFLHSLLFDNIGKFAYHSAVHDGFGFLKNFYDLGPGYDYLSWKILGRYNMLAGQITGLLFWTRLNLEKESKKKEGYLL